MTTVSKTSGARAKRGGPPEPPHPLQELAPDLSPGEGEDSRDVSVGSPSPDASVSPSDPRIAEFTARIGRGSS